MNEHTENRIMVSIGLLIGVIGLGITISIVALTAKVNNNEKAITAFTAYTNDTNKSLYSHKVVIESLIQVVNNHAQLLNKLTNNIVTTNITNTK